jgi:hypothetical protein
MQVPLYTSHEIALWPVRRSAPADGMPAHEQCRRRDGIRLARERGAHTFELLMQRRDPRREVGIANDSVAELRRTVACAGEVRRIDERRQIREERPADQPTVDWTVRVHLARRDDEDRPCRGEMRRSTMPNALGASRDNSDLELAVEVRLARRPIAVGAMKLEVSKPANPPDPQIVRQVVAQVVATASRKV